MLPITLTVHQREYEMEDISKTDPIKEDHGRKLIKRIALEEIKDISLVK